jgi:hypothetical protein
VLAAAIHDIHGVGHPPGTGHTPGAIDPRLQRDQFKGFHMGPMGPHRPLERGHGVEVREILADRNLVMFRFQPDRLAAG